jgi:hypothetical protein
MSRSVHTSFGAQQPTGHLESEKFEDSGFKATLPAGDAIDPDKNELVSASSNVSDKDVSAMDEIDLAMRKA